MELEVYDDCIPGPLQDYFEALCLGKMSGIDVEPIVNFKSKYEDTAKEGNYIPLSFKHILRSSAETSPYFVNFCQIPINVYSHLNRHIKDIMFARIFLTMPYKTELPYHKPHTDQNVPHTGFIYYVNDSDGDTVFFENDYKTILRSVTPKKGRCAIFNGLIPHSAGIPKIGHRCIINYNII